MPPRTLFEKIWDAHVVREAPGEPTLLYIDLHLIHEVTTPQAFDGLRMTGRKVRRLGALDVLGRDGDALVRRLHRRPCGDAVDAFAAAWEGPLDILVNNAGVMATPETRTACEKRSNPFCSDIS